MERPDTPSAKEGFELTTAEHSLIKCAADGEFWYPLTPKPLTVNVEAIDTDKGKSDSLIRPPIIRCLLTGGRWNNRLGPWRIHERGLRIAHAIVEGDIDLVGCELTSSLLIVDSVVRGDILLEDARLRGLFLRNTRIGGMNAQRAHFYGNCYLDHDFEATSSINLMGARVDGQLGLRGAKLSGNGVVALACQGIWVRDSMYLTDGFRAAGLVDFGAAHIGGSFFCGGGRFENAAGVALNCDAITISEGARLDGIYTNGLVNFTRAAIHGNFHAAYGRFENTVGVALECKTLSVGANVLWGPNFHAKGPVSLAGATIKGMFDAQLSRFENPDGIALDGRSLKVGGDLWLMHTSVTGITEFSHAEIGEDLDCTGGHFLQKGGKTIDADSLKVGANLKLWDGFHAIGEVNLQSAAIGGRLMCRYSKFENENDTALNCNGASTAHVLGLNCHTLGVVGFGNAVIAGTFSFAGAQLRNPGHTAFDGHSLSVGANVILSDGFHAIGNFILSHASINGTLECFRARFEQGDAVALNCNSIKVGLSVLLTVRARGEVEFLGANIGGSVDCRGSSFLNTEGIALDLESARIGQTLILRQIEEMEGELALELAQIKVIADDGTAWKGNTSITLDGLTFQRFSATEMDWKTRLAWLQRQPKEHLGEGFRPQPWAQLIKVMRDMGYDNDARRIAIERERTIARRPSTRWYQKLWYRLLAVTVGYGYRPELALIWALGFILIGWLTFSAAASFGYMAPSDGSVVVYLAQNPMAPLPPNYPKLNSFVYTLDVFLPVISFDQDARWHPDKMLFRPSQGQNLYTSTRDAWVRAGFPRPLWARNLLRKFFVLGGHRLIYWIESTAGWVLISLFIAGMSGIMKAD